MIKLSLKGFASFMTASATRKRSILSDYKYPEEDKAQAKIFYYREARDRISAFHHAKRDRNWLIAESHHLQAIAGDSSEGREKRLKNNAIALRAYAKYFGHRNFEILESIKLKLIFDDVTISVYPDLHVIERGREKIVKLEFSVNQPSEDMIKIISQIMFEAANQAEKGLTASGVLYLDVRRGKEHRGARLGSRIKRDIQSTCLNISGIWDTV